MTCSPSRTPPPSITSGVLPREVHPERPWGSDDGCGCGAPGMPCEFCNLSGGPDDPPDMPPGFEVTR